MTIIEAAFIMIPIIKEATIIIEPIEGGLPAPGSGFPFKMEIGTRVKVSGRVQYAKAWVELNDVARMYLIEQLSTTPDGLMNELQKTKMSLVIE